MQMDEVIDVGDKIVGRRRSRVIRTLDLEISGIDIYALLFAGVLRLLQ